MSKRKPDKELWVDMFKKTEKTLSQCRKCGEIQSASLSREFREDKSLRKNCLQCVHKVLDTVLVEFPVRCKFAKYGCEEILMKDELKNHEDDCQYYEVNCPYLFCKSGNKMGFLSYLEHYNKAYNTKEELKPTKNENTFLATFYMKKLETKLPVLERDFCFFPKKKLAFNRLFFMTATARANKQFSAWVCLLGNQEEAKNFKVKISLETEFKFITNVHPMTLDSTTIETKKFPFMCPLDSILPLIDKNHLLTFEIKLISLKAEANQNEDAESGVSDVE